MSRVRFIALFLLVLAGAAILRTLWLRADPPPIDVAGIGVVWHDEGAWTHNARNRALWGVWETDHWNPVFVAPVFTALEYAAFRELGVGLWQARVVPVISGLVAIVFLALGLTVIADRRTALIGSVLLATNYPFVMWNRAALMESTMTAFIVIAWAAYAQGERRPGWGFIAGIAVVLAWFTKAAAAFFVVALLLDVATTLVATRLAPVGDRTFLPKPTSNQVRAAGLTLVGLALAGAVIVLAFVVPHWAEYRFYNWEMSVLRKPEYDLHHFVDRATWLPIVEGIFMRMWLVLALAAVAIFAIVARWPSARPAERLLVLWVVIGLLELVVHDSGNDRRYVMFVPALVALASWLIGYREPVFSAPLAASNRTRLLIWPLVFFFGYLVAGAALRPAFFDDIAANHFHRIVVLAAGLAALTTALVLWRWPQLIGWLSRRPVPQPIVVVFVVGAVSWNLVEYGLYGSSHRETNYEASVALGRWLPPNTLVQGKLANGLALDNLIRPLFIGNHFGNYDDRLQREDVRYILTYDLPSVGYESQADSGLIRELLDHYPQHHTVATFEVDETRAPDRAALIEKRPQ